MRKFIFNLLGYGVILEKTEKALKEVTFDNETLRSELSNLREESKKNEAAHYALSEKYENLLRKARVKSEEFDNLKAKYDALVAQNENVGAGVDEAIATLNGAKAEIAKLQKECEHYKAIADKAEEYREAHNRKRREKRARAKAEKQNGKKE